LGRLREQLQPLLRHRMDAVEKLEVISDE